MNPLRWLDDRIHRLHAKQIVLGILCAVLLFSPTFFAILSIYRENHEINSQELTVVLYSADGKELGRETGTPALSDEFSLVSIFSQLDLLKDPLSAAARDPHADTYVRALLTRGAETQELLCYFSTDGSSGICLDGYGNAFTIDPDVNRHFLSSPFGEAFFATAQPPVMTTIDGDTVLPSSVLWNYKSAEGEYLPTQRELSLSSSELYEMTGEIGILFSNPPDQCNVEVREGDRLVLNGHYSLLSELSVNSGSILSVKISAKWLKTDLSVCYGEISYDFRVRIKNPSEFVLSDDTISAGGFVFLSCTNISNPQKIQLTSSDLSDPVRFYRYGSVYRALLTLPEQYEKESLSLHVSYGASSQDFILQVTAKKEPNALYLHSWDLSDSPLLEMDSASHLQSLLTPLINQAESSSLYFRGNTQEPSRELFQTGYVHGSNVFWGDEPEEPLSVLGTEYLSASTQVVTAWDCGIVIDVGADELLGNYVVIDHGGGLLTWYGHLSHCSVAKGTVLDQGETLGRTGNTGLASGEGFLFLCSIHNQFIDPDALYRGVAGL